MERPTTCRLLLLPLLVALAVGLLPAGALANSGPPWYSGDTGGPLLPGKSDQVHVLRETLRFDLSPDLEEAAVTARYTLANRGPALPAQPFVFVIQARGDDPHLTATWQGEPLAVEAVDRSQFTADELAAMADGWTTVGSWMDPVTGEPYDAGAFYGPGAGLRYFRFAVALPAEAEGELVVAYRHAAAWDRARHAHRVYHYQYLLLPARSWASFGPLEVRVAAPEGSRHYFAGNLDFRREGGEYVARLPGLPEENLAFAVMDRTGLLFGLTQPGPYYWMGFAGVLLLAALIGAGIGRLAGLLPSRRWAPAAGALGGLLLGGALDVLLAVLLLMSLPALKEQPYGPIFAGIGQGLVGAVVTAAVAARSAGRSGRRSP